MTTSVLLFIAQLFLLTSCSGEEVTTPNTSSTIEKKIIRIAKEKNIPSLEVTITFGEEVLDFQYTNKALKKQEIYGVGSTTKFLSSVLIFKFIEEGKLHLGDTITDYVNLHPAISDFDKITIQNLLNHTSGLSDYTKNPEWIASIMNNSAPKTFEEKLLLVADSLSNVGSFSYSNTNYLFLERVIETITEQDYETVFNDFYSANDLSDIKIGVNETGLQAFFAQTAEVSSDVSAWREYYGFDGGAFANARALNRFLAKLYGSHAILSANSLMKLEQWISMEPMTIPIGKGEISEYGNGIMRLTYNGQEYLGHFGSTLKYQSMAFYNSEQEVSICLITNCSGRYFNNVFFQELIPAILDEL